MTAGIKDQAERGRRLTNIIRALSRFFWFTVEFGLMRGPKDNIVAYGSGLLSSYGELQHTIESDEVQRYPVQLEWLINQGAEILKERGWPEEIWYGVLSHADYANAPRTTPMQKVLYAVDELVGFVAAVALVRPSKAVADVDVQSVKKKFKDKAFARGVHREQIFTGAEQLGVDLDQHIQVVIDAMKGNAAVLGLAGTPPP